MRHHDCALPRHGGASALLMLTGDSPKAPREDARREALCSPIVAISLGCEVGRFDEGAGEFGYESRTYC